MYARILPLRRLPKRFDAFTYAVPETLHLTPGQFVHVPFRNTSIFGIVFSVASTTTDDSSKIKLLEDVVKETPVLSAQHIEFLANASRIWGISRATAASMMMPPLAKTKIKKLELRQFCSKKIQAPEIPTHTLYQTEKEHAEFLSKTIQGATLILVPETHLIDEVRGLLPIELQQKTVVWHGALSQKQQFERWVQIRNGEKDIIIGTRGAIWLPFFQLDTIILDYEHDENHKHWDQAPRFHAKDAIALLAPLYDADVHLASFSMSAESYYRVHKNEYTIHDTDSTTQTKQTKKNPPTLVNMKDERKGGNYSLFSDKTAKAILEATGDVFLYLNRRGYSTAVGCNGCGYIARCKTCTLPMVYSEKNNTLQCKYCSTSAPMFILCPSCHSVVVKLIGAGTELAEKEVRKLLGEQHKRLIIRIDGDQDEPLPYSKIPRIIIGTDRALPYLRWQQLSLTVFVDIDKQIAIPEYLAGERMWHLIAEMQFRTNPEHKCLIQTFEPTQLLLRSLIEPERWYRTELNTRRGLHYPPYIYLARYFYGHPHAGTAENEAKRVHALLETELTKAGKHVILTHPIAMQPQYFRRQFWYTMSIKMHVDSWQDDIAYINSLMPDNWKIDPNPISLLNP